MSKKTKIENFELEEANLVTEMADGRQRVVPIVVSDDEPQEEVEIPEYLPILTLRSSVLFPGAITPITVGRDKSIALVRAVNQEGGMLGAVLQRESEVDDPTPADMYRVGAQRQPDGDSERSAEDRGTRIHRHAALFQGACQLVARYDARSEERRV